MKVGKQFRLTLKILDSSCFCASYIDVPWLLETVSVIGILVYEHKWCGCLHPVKLSEDRQGTEEVSVWSSLGVDIAQFKPYFSTPKVLEFPTQGGKTAFVNFYPPKNCDFVGPAAERPPLLLRVHGVCSWFRTTPIALLNIGSCIWLIYSLLGVSHINSLICIYPGLSGGPTDEVKTTLSLELQIWTSRG